MVKTRSPNHRANRELPILAIFCLFYRSIVDLQWCDMESESGVIYNVSMMKLKSNVNLQLCDEESESGVYLQSDVNLQFCDEESESDVYLQARWSRH